MSDLPRDVTEEVLSRLPVTSLGGARSTCKKWNTLTKDESFFKKHLLEAAKKKQRKEVQVVMLLEHKVYLMSVDLINPSPSIERIGKLVSLDDDDAAADGVGISNIFHCDGLLLCVTKDIMNSGLVVWNPYSGQTKWIEPRNSYHRFDRYAIGYEKKDKNLLRSHKVLRFVDAYNWSVKRRVCEFGIYNLNSNSWKVIDVNPDWSIGFYQRGVSLKGNTYWFAQEKVPTVQGPAISDLPDFLLCFDFTRERFGPRLPLPFHSFEDIVALSSVREEQLAVLFQKSGAPAYPLKIWISSKIDPNAVSWNKLFLDVDMKPLTGFQFLDYGGSFFLDEKEEVAVVLDKDRDTFCPTRNIAYIIGKNGYFKQVDLGGSAKADCWPLVCSYVPSSVQIKQPAPLGKQRNTP